MIQNRAHTYRGAHHDHHHHGQHGVHNKHKPRTYNKNSMQKSNGTAVVAVIHMRIHTYMYIYSYHRTLPALPHDCFPTLEPGTKFRISARFMSGGDETPRAHQGVLLGRWAESRPFSRRVRGAPAPRSSLETQGVPSSGAGPSQNGTCLGGWHREQEPGREDYCNLFSAREDLSLYTPVRLHRVKEWVL